MRAEQELDEIIIENLKIFAHHGVYQEENEKGQNFYVNAVLYSDTRKAGIEDNLALTTDYGTVCEFLHRFIRSRAFALIETVAEETAKAVLTEFPLLEGVTLEIRKPEAPIGLEVESVSVKITRRWHTVCLSLGSNMGERKKYIEDGIKAIESDPLCKDIQVSDLIRSTPYGETNQNEFINGALIMKTLYHPMELLDFLHEIEKAAGRERLIHWGPRTLDLDILLYDDLILHTARLSIPHLDMINRDFVLQPLAQIEPYRIHPVSGKTIIQLWKDIQNEGEKHVL